MRSRILAPATQAPATWIQGQGRIAIGATWAWEVLRTRALAQIRQSDRGTEARTLPDQQAEADHPVLREVAADQVLAADKNEGLNGPGSAGVRLMESEGFSGKPLSRVAGRQSSEVCRKEKIY